MRLVFSGSAGQAFAAMTAAFIYLVPALVGALTVYVAEKEKRRSWGYYFGAGFVANFLFVLGTLLILIEGLICAIVIAPLFGVLGGLGGMLMGAICRRTNWPGKALYSMGVLPLVLGAVDGEVPTNDRFGTVEKSVIMAASAPEIWGQILNAPEVKPDEIQDAWMFRIGVPLTRSAALTESSGERVRKVVMGKNIHFDEVITDWDEPRYLRWVYRYDQDSFPPYALDEHVVLGGHYFDITETSYTLAPVGTGTEVRIRISYRVTTRFNWYADPVARLLMDNLAAVNLNYYRGRSEAAVRR